MKLSVHLRGENGGFLAEVIDNMMRKNPGSFVFGMDVIQRFCRFLDLSHHASMQG